jgi:hypothetical protein
MKQIKGVASQGHSVTRHHNLVQRAEMHMFVVRIGTAAIPANIPEVRRASLSAALHYISPTSCKWLVATARMAQALRKGVALQKEFRVVDGYSSSRASEHLNTEPPHVTRRTFSPQSSYC